MNQAELFNIYVEKLTAHVSELTKNTLLKSAQITYYERTTLDLNNRILELQSSLEEALNKVDPKAKKVDDF